MHDMILILNYSDEFSLEVARRLRAEQIYGRIISGMTTAAQVKELAPKGVILCGAVGNAPGVFDAGILDLGIPVLALGHASHMMLAAQGGASAGVALAEKRVHIQFEKSMLFAGIENGERYLKEVMTLMLPLDVQVTASAAGCTIAFEHTEKKQYGIQFELERNDPEGSTILKNFARDICACCAWWTEDAYRKSAEISLTHAAQEGDFAVCSVSGGIDSAVAAKLTRETFGEQMIALFVDTGLMRENEAEKVKETFEAMDIPLRVVDCSEQVLNALRGKMDMREKREVVLRLLHEEVIRQTASFGEHVTLVLGTNYSDVWTGGVKDSWEDAGLLIEEPLLNLFKSEVRTMACQMGFDEELTNRKPFPALGLGARIVGEVTQERLHALRTAERVFREEIELAGMHKKLFKYFPVMAGAVHVLGGEVVILRAVTQSGGTLLPARLPYDLVERTVARIREEEPSIARVFYDQTPTQVGQETFG
ncbi:MAG: phosphoadenosine phosphosulfate reductase family protein [Clostridia bacterium]|nr:phosphoadenosine phosphosulfate reductase family protein [Clostridia bacterium]